MKTYRFLRISLAGDKYEFAITATAADEAWILAVVRANRMGPHGTRRLVLMRSPSDND